LKVHACASLDTFADEIPEPTASRVFARSAFEYSHAPDAPALEAAAVVLMVSQPELATAVRLAPQAASSAPAATTTTALTMEREDVIAE
jgi:hypothetical protein